MGLGVVRFEIDSRRDKDTESHHSVPVLSLSQIDEIGTASPVDKVWFERRRHVQVLCNSQHDSQNVSRMTGPELALLLYVMLAQ